ncbi:hypothetical protein FOXG_21802 [Fusarium oxysporum f. sp. lycopersici 4287]|uniref:Uncharacterized protein n=1 Tax=Fusarium oxysporum f. sp. lycopersici (strain 4287 / CBS 123668 / FGSC 9935 / NRRL 34936) TaxID=426428 RepID=A0A0J9W134_FUSO4|nr:hypothetical protein FOXG_21802 [Fusarium oxysporum f. sp. lycopersici 4287]KNB16814.1 hypothetical protein FOXG_21802 [Fusarium oxysporum f. sp. lycopersici 4287]
MSYFSNWSPHVYDMASYTGLSSSRMCRMLQQSSQVFGSLLTSSSLIDRASRVRYWYLCSSGSFRRSFRGPKERRCTIASQQSSYRAKHTMDQVEPQAEHTILTCREL